MVGRTHRLDPGEVDEVFQEVRIRVWKAGQVERIAELPASYVYRTAASAALDFIRRRRARRDDTTDSLDSAHGRGAAAGPDPRGDPELGERDRVGTRRPPGIPSRRGADASGRLWNRRDRRASGMDRGEGAESRVPGSGRPAGSTRATWSRTGGTAMNDDELRKAYQARRAVASGTGPRRRNSSGWWRGRAPRMSASRSSTGPCRTRRRPASSSCSARSPWPLRHRQRRGWWRAPVPLAIAATILLVVAVWSQRGRPREETRATPDDGGPVLLAPAADARVADSVAFMWRAVPGARSYRVELLTDAGTLVISIENGRHHRARRRPGGRWRLDLSLVGGRAAARRSRSRLPASACHLEGPISQTREREPRQHALPGNARRRRPQGDPRVRIAQQHEAGPLARGNTRTHQLELGRLKRVAERASPWPPGRRIAP